MCRIRTAWAAGRARLLASGRPDDPRPAEENDRARADPAAAARPRDGPGGRTARAAVDRRGTRRGTAATTAGDPVLVPVSAGATAALGHDRLGVRRGDVWHLNDALIGGTSRSYREP